MRTKSKFSIFYGNESISESLRFKAIYNRLFCNQIQSVRGYRSRSRHKDKMSCKKACNTRINHTGKRMSVCNIQGLSSVKGVLTVRGEKYC